MDLDGGKRRHRKAHTHESKKMNKTHKKGKGKVNNILKSWVTFVKKIQKDEHIENYKDAIKRASQRKSEWKRGQMGGMSTSTMSSSEPMPSSSDTSMTPAVISSSDMTGGRKSRRRRSRARK